MIPILCSILDNGILSIHEYKLENRASQPLFSSFLSNLSANTVYFAKNINSDFSLKYVYSFQLFPPTTSVHNIILLTIIINS